MIEQVDGSLCVRAPMVIANARALLEVGRAAALLSDRDFLIPDDLKRFVIPVWAHRVRLTAEAEIEGLTPAAAVERVAQSVEVPH